MKLLWQNANDANYYTFDGGMFYSLLLFIALAVSLGGAIRLISWILKKIRK